MSGSTRASDDWPFVASKSLRIVGGEGASLIADDGRRILDAAGGAIVSNVGHGRREVIDAMTKGGATASYVVPIWRTPEREALVTRLRERWLPKNLHHIHLTGGGSEGVEAAVKIALQHFAARGEKRRIKACRATSPITARRSPWRVSPAITPGSAAWKASCKPFRMRRRHRRFGVRSAGTTPMPRLFIWRRRAQQSRRQDPIRLLHWLLKIRHRFERRCDRAARWISSRHSHAL